MDAAIQATRRVACFFFSHDSARQRPGFPSKLSQKNARCFHNPKVEGTNPSSTTIRKPNRCKALQRFFFPEKRQREYAPVALKWRGRVKIHFLAEIAKSRKAKKYLYLQAHSTFSLEVARWVKIPKCAS